MLEKRNIEYLGIDSPKTKQELLVEILGLRNAIKTAEEKISRIEQAIAIAELQKESNG
jgi:hypothetical protein